MNKAVFIDRDGVINNDEGHYYIYKPQDFRINEGVIENICSLKKAGFLVIIISNQGGIGKSLCTKKDTDLLHQILIEELAENNCVVDEIYYCPHHPDTGNCICRKPDSLMIEKALARFSIDASRSFLIGDSKRDIEAAEKAGVKGFLVEKNKSISKTCEFIINAEQ